MIAASVASGICNLAPTSLHLSNCRERDLKKSSVRRHGFLNWMPKKRRIFDAITFKLHHLEQSAFSVIEFTNRRSPKAAGVKLSGGNTGCIKENASSQCVSTLGQLRQISIVKNFHRRPSMRKVRKSMNSPVVIPPGSRAVGSCNLSTLFEKTVKQKLHHRQSELSENRRMDLDTTQDTRKQSHRAFLAALGAAGYVVLSLKSSASAAELLRVNFSDPVASTAVLEVQFTGSMLRQLEGEIQTQRQLWRITSVSATAPPVGQSQQSQSIDPVSVQESRNAVPELVENSEDPFQAWLKIQQELELEGEISAVPLTRPVAPPSPVKKVVAASVAVAVAGAASTAGRAVASTGGSAVVTSLTVLQQSPLSVSRFLARVAQHLGGGSVAGAVGATVVYPLDTIKTRMQAQNLDGDEPQYKDEIDCFKQLVTKEGPASLYSGLVPQLLGIAPEKAMKLTVNEILLSNLETMMPGSRLWALEFIAGGGGGASQVVFTNPMEIVKVRLQTQKEGAPKKTFWTIVKELGVAGLYEGAGVTLARDVPSSAIFFAIYTLLRQLYPDQSFLAGAIAAIPATILVTPMDIIKTRLQKEPAPGEQQYTDWWECLQDIVNKEGPQALFKGSLLRVLRTSPQFGITLMLYGILCEGS